jgi:hypothetical protein
VSKAFGVRDYCTSHEERTRSAALTRSKSAGAGLAYERGIFGWTTLLRLMETWRRNTAVRATR